MTRIEVELVLYILGAIGAFYRLALLLFRIRQNAKAIQRRLDVQKEMADLHAVYPRDPACGLMSLHRRELEQLQSQRRLRLAVRNSSRGM